MNAQSAIETPLAKLRVPFADHHISKLPKPTKAQTEAVKADFKKGIRCQQCGSWHHPDVIHLDYVGHAALTDRLLDTDIEWYWEPLAFTEMGLPAFDQTGGLWIKLTVAGVTRLGYGHAASKPGADPGAREKEVIGDALRNAAMRFGAALDLWHKGDLHAEDEENAASGPAAQAGSARGQTGGRAASPTEPATTKQPAHSKLKSEIRSFVHDMEGCGDWDTWVALRDSKDGQSVITGCKENLPDWWHGWPDQPDGFIPLSRRIEILEGNLANQIADYARV